MKTIKNLIKRYQAYRDKKNSPKIKWGNNFSGMFTLKQCQS